MKKIVERFLHLLVRIKLSRTKPTIIGITGSYGKTTTKEAVYKVLQSRWRVRKSGKSLNTEIGLLLAVLGQPSGFRSPVKWLQILATAAADALAGKKCDFLVLEYGADKPGDIGHLISLVRPDIGIITHVSRVHQAEGQFKNEEEVFDEKKKLAECLPAEGTAILNGRDEWLYKLRGKLAAKIFWFSSGAPTHEQHIFADHLQEERNGFSATIHCGVQEIHAQFPIAGSFHINSMLPALLVGTLHGIPLKEGIKTLAHFCLPPGRMSIIPGKNGSLLLDSTYNASPETVIQALELLKNFPGKRKIAVLGNMNELGGYTGAGHQKVGRHIGHWLDLLITVGEAASTIAEESLKNGFPKARIKSFLTAREAAEFLLSKHRLHKDDAVLLKGSQNQVRLERAMALLMARPEDAKKLLCRQEDEWSKIP